MTYEGSEASSLVDRFELSLKKPLLLPKIIEGGLPPRKPA